MRVAPQTEARSAERHGELALAAGLYAALIVAIWLVARDMGVARRLEGHLLAALVTFAALFLPYWAFGWGAAAPLRRRLTVPAARMLAPGLLAVPYLGFTVAAHAFAFPYFALAAAYPIGLAVLFEATRHKHGARLGWPDAIALPALGVPIMLNWLGGMFPFPGLGTNFVKLLLIDAALYAYLVVRDLPHVGFDVRLRARDWLIGLRECAWFTPVAIGLGLALGFIRFHPARAHLGLALGGWLATFLFVAVPEETFFRGFLQNLFETRCHRNWALLAAAVLFGASHFHHPPVPNWRYMILAALAGIFYGRAWRDRHRIGCSAITHATVDTIWGLWFHL